MSGYEADPAELAAAAVRLGESAEDVHAAAKVLQDGAGDLGPAGIAEAVGELTRRWAARMLAVHADLVAVERDIRASHDAYVDVDEQVADDIRRTGDG